MFFFINILHASISLLNRIIRSSIRSIFNIKQSEYSFTDSFQLLLNWFPYKKRLLIRLLSLTHTSLYYSTPSYIFDLLLMYSITYDKRPISRYPIRYVYSHPPLNAYMLILIYYNISLECTTFIYIIDSIEYYI